MRDCDGCKYCCDGHLIGTVNDKQFGFMNPCHNLVETGCSIHEDRPSMCSNYFCAWAQELLPEWMKPDICGAVVSVEIDADGVQFLKAVSLNRLPPEASYALQQFADANGTYFTFVKVIPIASY